MAQELEPEEREDQEHEEDELDDQRRRGRLNLRRLLVRLNPKQLLPWEWIRRRLRAPRGRGG